MSSTAIDFSKYQDAPTIDFSKYEGGSPITSTATIGPAPQTSTADVLRHVANIPIDPLGEIGNGLDAIRQKLMSSEHPAAQAIGQKLTDAKELLMGGQSVGKPMGTSSGVANNPVTSTIGSVGIGAPEASEAGVGALNSARPSVQMAKAGKQFQELKGAIGGHTVAMTDALGDALSDIKGAVDTGSTLPSVVNKFVTRIADTDQGPLTYQEARQFYHNLSDLSVSERMATKPSDQRLLNAFKHALGNSISDTAASAGKLEQYQGAMKGFAKGAQQQEQVQAVKDFATKKVVPALLYGAGAGAAGAAGYKVFRDMMGSQ